MVNTSLLVAVVFVLFLIIVLIYATPSSNSFTRAIQIDGRVVQVGADPFANMKQIGDPHLVLIVCKASEACEDQLLVRNYGDIAHTITCDTHYELTGACGNENLCRNTILTCLVPNGGGKKVRGDIHTEKGKSYYIGVDLPDAFTICPHEPIDVYDASGRSMWPLITPIVNSPAPTRYLANVAAAYYARRPRETFPYFYMRNSIVHVVANFESTCFVHDNTSKDRLQIHGADRIYLRENSVK